MTKMRVPLSEAAGGTVWNTAGHFITRRLRDHPEGEDNRLFQLRSDKACG